MFHRYDWIYRPLSGGTWLSAKEGWKLTDSEILKAIACAHQKFYIGARAGKTTQFAVIDIDTKSRYHSLPQLQKIIETLAAAGIKRHNLYRSSYSGGWHLYLFFDEPIKSRELHEALTGLFRLTGFQTGKGTLEIFPNPGQNSTGMGLRLPLQPGWAWLDSKTLEIEHERNDLSATEALELFIDCLDGNANSYADSRRLKAHVQELFTQREHILQKTKEEPSNNNVVSIRRRTQPEQPVDSRFVESIFGVLPPGMDVETWMRGYDYYQTGLQAPSQRADFIFSVGHYLFYGDPSRSIEAQGYGCQQQREWLIAELLSTKHNGHSKDINRSRHDAFAQVHRATHWVPPHKRGEDLVPYAPKVPIAWTRNSANLKADARKRIKTAVEELVAEDRPFTVRELLERAKCHHSTLKSHADLWQSAYEQAQQTHLATVAGEYNAVVGVGSPETQPPASTHDKNMPPGRLAARRLIYEMQMRAERQRRQKVASQETTRLQNEEQWRQGVLEHLPQDLTAADLATLKAVLALLAWYLLRSPSYDDQVWLTDIMQSIKTELAQRSLGPQSASRSPPDST